MDEYILEMKDIVKRFPGTLALDKVGLNLKRGEIVALIGENGAGKSTLMNVLMGVYKKDEGTILLNGKEIENNSPYDALKKGIGMVPQELNLVPEITIGENIFLGSHQKKGALIDWRSTMKNAKEILERLNVDVDPEMKASSISAAYQQLVSIARTIAVDSQVIVLDEPTASLTTVEIKKLFETVEILKKEGRAIIFITHHLDEVEEMADRVFIMRDGKLVKTAEISELSIDDMIYYMANERVRKI
ncbi:MAG: sugar ABC transporter ATP-binding protein, partial [Eubacterium sp.]|nr:sugar ABC transporter ATP-binding protein [Eubacterium sp.]